MTYPGSNPPHYNRIGMYILLTAAALLAVVAIGVATYTHLKESDDVRSVACQSSVSLYTAYEFLKFRTNESTTIPPKQKHEAILGYTLLEKLVPVGKCNLTPEQLRAEARQLIARAVHKSQ